MPSADLLIFFDNTPVIELLQIFIDSVQQNGYNLKTKMTGMDVNSKEFFYY